MLMPKAQFQHDVTELANESHVQQTQCQELWSSPQCFLCSCVIIWCCLQNVRETILSFSIQASLSDLQVSAWIIHHDRCTEWLPLNCLE